MRILLIHNLYKQPGGEDAVFRAEYNLLLQNGHEVKRMLYHNSVINSFFDKLIAGFKTIYNPESARVLRNRIEEFNPDVIHVHNFLPLVSPSVFFVARKFNVPVVLTLHNYRLICPSATLFHDGAIYEKSMHSIFPFDAVRRGVYRNSIIETAAVALMTAFYNLLGTWKNQIDCYITLTQFSKKKFENSALAIPAAKLLVKPNFVEDKGAGNKVRENFFLFIGRLTEEKGIKVLLEAASLKKFRLVVMGDGPLKELVEQAAQQNPNVINLGLQDKSTVISFLKKCSALIFPSIWYEGFPVTILEAFSTGTPVIASNLGSMAEIIQDKVNGLHFEPGNSEDLVAKITEVKEDENLTRTLSIGARASYLELYTPEKNYSQLMGIYNIALERYSTKASESKRFPTIQLKKYAEA